MARTDCFSAWSHNHASFIDAEDVLADAQIIDGLSDAEQWSDDEDSTSGTFEERAPTFFTTNPDKSIANALVTGWKSGRRGARSHTAFALSALTSECRMVMSAGLKLGFSEHGAVSSFVSSNRFL